jgi:DNA-binding NarL/FixJ family response regulator
MNNSIKVVICDDHSLFRQGVKTWLETKDNIDVVGEIEDGLKLVKYLKHVQPDVILLDINMPVMDGNAALVEIKKHYPNIKVIILTMNDSPQMVSELLKIGANAYLTKNDDVSEIYKAIISCYENGEYINERNAKAILETLREVNPYVPQTRVTLEHQPEPEIKKRKFNILKVILWGVLIAVIATLSIYFYLILKNNFETISNIDFSITKQ